jgi:DNA-binding GntR family transcriptional regulator
MSSSSDPEGPASPMRIGRVAAPIRDQVLENVREAILSGALAPGQRLIERELIEQTGTSRTTVREVLRHLETEGLIVNIPNKGAIVVVLTSDEAADIYEIRAELEAFACRRAAVCATAEQRAELLASAEAYRDIATGDGGFSGLLEAKDRFYEALFEAAGNSSIRTIISGLHARMRAMRARSLSKPGRAVETADELLRIVRAIEAGDADEAARACVEHIHRAAAYGVPDAPR